MDQRLLWDIAVSLRGSDEQIARSRCACQESMILLARLDALLPPSITQTPDSELLSPP